MSNEEQEYDEVSEPESTFLWPDSGLSEDVAEMWLSQNLVSAHVLTGQVCDLTEADVDTWSGLLEHSPGMNIRLILLLYPACRTRREALVAFNQLQQEFTSSIKIRVAPLDQYGGTPTTVICCYDDKGRSTGLAMGPRVSLNDSTHVEGQINLAFKADPLLADRYRKWFDRRWKEAVQLSDQIIDIPHLVPVRGSADAAEAWSRYLALVQHVHDAAEFVQPQENTGETDYLAGADESQNLSVELGLQQMTELEQQVSKLFEKGHLVTIDKATRLKPLDAPMQPEWFGVEGVRQEGAVSRKVQYRISVLDENTLRALETKRKKIASLLGAFSFSLADGARWMPLETVPLFEKELEHVNNKGKSLLQETIGQAGLDAFVSGQRDRLRGDANRMYRDFHPDGTLSEHIVDAIMAELKGRLRSALDSNLLPRVSYTAIQPAPYAGSQWSSPFGQVYCLLLSIAKYTRNAITNRYFFQGLEVDEGQLLSAMNVCGDYIVGCREERGIYKLAHDELGFITYIESSPSDVQHKCKALLDLMKGVPIQEIAKELDQTS